MSAQYDLYETPSPDGEMGKKSLHARVRSIKTISQEEFLNHVALNEHLPKNLLGGALQAIVDDLGYLLSEGYIVEVGELGFFSTSLKCLQETDDENDKIRSESVTFKNVNLRISSAFRKKMKKMMKLERVHSLTRTNKKITSTVEERKVKLAAFLKENICISRKEYIKLTLLTPSAAMVELNSFIAEGVLRRRGTTRSAVYVAGEKMVL